MARPAPAVRRIAGIMAFLADRPDETFSLSEIARANDLSPATAHAMLMGLAEEGLLLRDPRSKKYSLGPLLVRLGSAAAARRNDVVTLAREQLRAVSTSVGRQATVTRVVGGHILIMATEGDPGPWGMSLQVGQRLPMAPPLGSVFVAWSPKPVIERWLCAVTGAPSREALERCADALATVRRRGWAVSLNVSEAHRGLSPRMSSGDLHPGLGELLESSYFLNEVDDEQAYPLRQVSAPVFDANGEVTVALSITYVGESRTGRDISHDAQVLLAAADGVTAAIHGSPPIRRSAATQEDA